MNASVETLGFRCELPVEATAEIPTFVSFASPPVNEVYLSVQFASAVADEAVTLADFWPKLRTAFPGLERQPALPRLDERFDAPSASPFPTIPFPFSGAQPPLRYWFTSTDATRLIQVQPDRFWFNWRRVRETDEYPRYHALRPEFQSASSALLESLPEDRRAGAAIDMCEVGYINHVDARGEINPNSHLPLHRIFSFIGEPPAEALVPVEDMQFQLRSVIRGGDGTPLGRTYLNVVPAFRAADRMPIYVIELTVRGKPSGTTLSDALSFLDRGRALIVKTFRDTTSDEFHDKWGIEEETAHHG